MTSGIMKRALQEAEKSTFKQFRVSAIIFSGPRILSTGTNGIRSHSKINKKFQEYLGSIHAEQQAILTARRNLKGTSMLVVRINKHGKLGMARPCKMCWGFLKNTGIRDVYYSTSNGEIAYERI